MNGKKITVGFVGNPNCGKTTLFNAYTGANLKVANWPGVTVERVEGAAFYQGHSLRLIDLPGIYSLTSYSMEERVARRCILEEEIDVIVNIVDASSLERNLYLTMQLLEFQKPMVLALNMMDIVEERGIEIDTHRLSELLGGIPVVPVSARKRTGLDVLLQTVVHLDKKGTYETGMTYTKEMEAKLEKLEKALRNTKGAASNSRFLAIKLLERDEEMTKLYPLELPHIGNKRDEKQIVKEKYDYIEEIVKKCLFYRENAEAVTEKADRYLTHRIWGIPIFLLILALVFFLTFTVGDFLKGYFEIGLEWLSDGLRNFLLQIRVSDWLISLAVDGIVAGVGGILTFLPNIAILFLALAFLEDSGYMARVAYVMNEIMGSVGLSGKAFLPMILGFGCTVPAIMASRGLENERDRRRAMLVTPFMSCSARLPIYVLFSHIFFGKYAMIAAYSLYVVGALVAILIAKAVNRRFPLSEENALLIELPAYKMPNARTVFIYVWEKVKDYLTKAGTIIFLVSVFLWLLLNYNWRGPVQDVSASFGAYLGRILVPFLRPAGLGMWQIAVALLCGLSAKEVVVSSCAVLFSVSNINSSEGMAQLGEALGAGGFGPVNAYAFLVFCLLYTPCAATIGTIRRESHSWRFTIQQVFFQLFLAWALAVLVFQVGSFFFG
ncbi:ferrous iron transport protein B [Hominifimenecus sp. rT4P-3]|uniref:ferrous iron transport protein B n=1 Tax=Hominifimenecus sp. rT4P-3 TaxID=3242979 RepID=UPI003DA4C1A0